jgi:chromatin segregation and condensation protein Rec8/ScpA/Scc1 (kleisin family)
VYDLEFKLELYALLVQASTQVRTLYAKRTLYSRSYKLQKNVHVFVPDERVTSIFLQSVISLTLQSFIIPKALAKVAVEQALRIENVIEKLLDRIKNVSSMSLLSLADNVGSKEDQKKVLIVNFIALLELLRTGSIHAEQHVDGGDITITA